MGENGLTMEYPAWANSTDAVLQHHGVDASHGLTDAQVVAQRERYGYNELEKEPPKALWKLVLEQFDDMLVKVGRRTLCFLLQPRSADARRRRFLRRILLPLCCPGGPTYCIARCPCTCCPMLGLRAQEMQPRPCRKSIAASRPAQ